MQFISSPNSIDMNDTSDLVHEYTIDAGVWTYTAWQPAPDGFQDESYFILLSQYDDTGITTNWSTQVRFDGNDGLAVFQGCHNDLADLPLNVGQWVELRVEIDLDNDWQQFYYGGNLLFEGSWSDGMSGDGITSIGAVGLFANGASPVYYDDLSLVETTGENTMHMGGIDGVFILDYMNRPVLRIHILVEDQSSSPLANVLVTAWVWVPDRGPIERERFSKPNGYARFRWGSKASGTWTLCVQDLELPDYLYVPDDDVVTCMDWFY